MQPFDFQTEALAEIVARGRVFFSGIWQDPAITVRPRFHSLLAAPTGSGKSAMASMAAGALDANLLMISAPGWVPAGASNRGVAQTISTIAAAVVRNQRTLLVTDEADKLVESNDNGWKSYVLGEIYQLCDGRWPEGLALPDDEYGNEIPLAALTQKLRESVFILAIGTFQDFFDSAGSRRTIGFSATDAEANNDELTSAIVASLLPRELANRWNSSIIRIPELQPRHYRLIAKQAEDALPERMQGAFRAEVDRRIAGAISAKKGVRFLEEVMMEVLKTLPPEPKFDLIIYKPNTVPDPDAFDSICAL